MNSSWISLSKSLASYIKSLDTEIDNAIVFKIDQELFGTAKPVVMVFAHLPPTQSPYHDHTENGYGVEIIEKIVLDICDNTEEVLLLMCGDFNARTGTGNGTRDAENLDDVFL